MPPDGADGKWIATIGPRSIADVTREQLYCNPIVTQIEPASTFYVAEDYHQEYFARNPRQGYCQFVVAPKLAKFRKSFSNPQAMVPNQVELLEFSMPDIHHTFRRGHRIMVQVQSSWFPLVDRNPQKYVANIFQADDKDFIKAAWRHKQMLGGSMRQSGVTSPPTPASRSRDRAG